MHHFIFSSKDTFISNNDGLSSKNFGIDQFIHVGSTNIPSISYEESASSHTFSNGVIVSEYVQNFVGSFTGSLFCGESVLIGDIICNIDSCFSYPLFDDNGNYIITDGDEYLFIDSGDVFIFP